MFFPLPSENDKYTYNYSYVVKCTDSLGEDRAWAIYSQLKSDNPLTEAKIKELIQKEAYEKAESENYIITRLSSVKVCDIYYGAFKQKGSIGNQNTYQ